MIRLIIAFIVAFSAPALAQSRPPVSPAAFDAAFNAVARQIGIDVTLTKVGCGPNEPARCEFGSVPDLRLIANGSDPNGDIDEVSVYLPRSALDKARSKRSALNIATTLTVLIGTFNPEVPPKQRGSIINGLMKGATSSLTRGSAKVGGVEYVLSATQADNLRAYVTRD